MTDVSVLDDWIRNHGAEDILGTHEVESLQAAVYRVLVLMIDMQWHDANEIKLAAGSDGIPASEGLRRMRDLRPILKKLGLEIEKNRNGKSRLYRYRIVRGNSKV